MNRNKYITTTLPYINSKPHIGHALEFIQADALKRYFESAGYNVFLNVGVDEHGSKVYLKSQELGIETQEYCNQQAEQWIEFCKKFNISYDNFYRTTNIDHKNRVQKFWVDCVERGDIYKSKYKGKYCIGCESFKVDKDLVNGKCSDHDTVPVELDEENWFFRSTKYKQHLLDWLSSSPDFLKPSFKITELVNLINESEDISISRSKTSVPWGVPVPGDETQTIYVWFEALLNYIFALEYNMPEKLADSFWSDSLQICGPDNIRFQGSIFQAFLASASKSHTSQLLVHGTVLGADGKKMSKTLGNGVDPIEQIEKYGIDAVRYYALAGISTFYNSSWDEKELAMMCNNDLADSFGNLFARVMHLRSTKGFSTFVASGQFTEHVVESVAAIEKSWKSLEINTAIKQILELLSFGNKYMNEREPWKNPSTERETLDNLYSLLLNAVILLNPVVPNMCVKAREALMKNEKVILFEKIKIG